MGQQIIGLTGGIATGKSTVATYLQKCYRLPLLDADLYAREAMNPDLVDLIVARYGLEILSNGTLDRSQLGKIIFQDVNERKWLESQIHPYVRDRLRQTANNYAPASVVMVVPLLFEAGMQDLVTETWVVTCDLELERLRQRDRLSLPEAKLRIASQMPITEKIKMADFVLNNSGTPEQLFEQVDKLMATRFS